MFRKFRSGDRMDEHKQPSASRGNESIADTVMAIVRSVLNADGQVIMQLSCSLAQSGPLSGTEGM